MIKYVSAFGAAFILAMSISIAQSQDNNSSVNKPQHAPITKIVDRKPQRTKQNEDCKIGCAAADDHSKPLTEIHIEDLLTKLSQESYNEDSITLDTLLYHHKEVSTYLENNKNSLETLDLAWESLLDKEMKRKNFNIHIRVIDENGKRHINVNEKVKIGVHYSLYHKDVIEGKDLHIGGKSKRVGLHHIWARF